MKIRSLLAGALLSATPVVALVSGCGGGSAITPVPTKTPLSTATPIPTQVATEGPVANLTFVTESTDGSTFGRTEFTPNSTVVSTGPVLTVGFSENQQRSISFEIPDTNTVTIGRTYQLSNSQFTVLAAVNSGISNPTFWGGAGKSQGSIVVESFFGTRYTFRLQDVELTRRNPTVGTSKVKVSGTFTVTLPPQ